MRKQNLAILAAAATIAFAAPALAQTTSPDVYVNGGYNHVWAGDDDVSTGTLTGRVGVMATPNLGAEVEGGLGIIDDEVNGVTLRTRGTLGAFAVARAPVATNMNLLARMGYLHTWAEADAGAISVKDDEGSFALGVGAEYMLDDRNGLRADYTRTTKGDGTNGFGVSYVRKF
jgi:hypothetical protein